MFKREHIYLTVESIVYIVYNYSVNCCVLRILIQRHDTYPRLKGRLVSNIARLQIGLFRAHKAHNNPTLKTTTPDLSMYAPPKP